MNEYSHITQSFLISSLTSVYFAWKWFLKQSQKQEKNDNDRELLKNIEIIRSAFLKCQNSDQKESGPKWKFQRGESGRSRESGQSRAKVDCPKMSKLTVQKFESGRYQSANVDGLNILNSESGRSGSTKVDGPDV